MSIILKTIIAKDALLSITDGLTRLTDTTASTSTTTGALVVSGGVGIGGALYTGGIIRFTDTTASTSVSSGALVVSGGVGIAENLYAGGITRLTDTTASTSSSTGALVVSGGVGIGGALYTGGIIRFTDTTASTSVSSGALVVSGGVGIAENLYAGGITRLTDTTASTSSSTGALVVSGGVGIAENLYAGGITRLTNTTASTSTSTGALVVSGGVGITGNLYAGGITRLTNTTSSTSSSTGALVVTGGVGVGGALHVGYQGDGVSALTFTRSDGPTFGRISGTGTTFNSIMRISNPSNDNGRIDLDAGVNGIYFSFGYSGSSTSRDFEITSSRASTSESTGALTVAGGVGIAGDLYTGGIARLTDTTESTSASTGALVVSGGVGIDGSLNVVDSSTMNNGRIRFINSNGFNYIQSGSSSFASSSASFRFGPTYSTSSWLTVSPEQSHISPTTESTSASTGALRVSGGAGIAGNLYADGIVRFTNTTASSSISTGALVVSGGIGASTGFIGTMDSNSTRTNFGFIGTDLSPYTSGEGEVGLSSRPWDKMHAAEFNVISDIRQKKDISIYTQGLGFITQLTPKSYKYKHSVSGKIKTGFMAQEVIEVNPTFEGVNYNETDDIYTMTMDQFIAPLVNCVKELNAKIISLETELIMMKNFLRSKFPDDGL